MKNNLVTGRRQFMKLGGLVASAIPLLVLGAKAHAATNPAMRTAMKYQATPADGKKCLDCAQFVPGKSAKDLGGCKLFAGDTEVSPNGYCVAWMAKAK